ncbi:beta-galactosidase trimerization domain-containing protein [Lignipirellula cremea]|uniref:Beta-galactosidase trimerization domain protein n=1 Tax=Lignipirellula cremea TaxID=2528010 RepID=A0A518DYC3_9BACT|nr:beta-galactosidase trimerization domain-containing protein [Lignipirellula cremea]QDU96846.1 Beta-galactosidase trimerization domain protein [Lignipirellula cremea]
MRCCIAVAVLVLSGATRHVDAQTPQAAQNWGKARPAITVQPDGLYVAEAEEFQPIAPQAEGWQAKPFGENYYAATFANCFLSRQAFLGAPAQCEESVATINVDIQEAGRYLVLVRYEAAYRFETQFRVQVEQKGKKVVDRLYGARKNVKVWAFRQKLQTEVGWSWGAVENVVWEGHNVFASLQPGPAVIRLIAGKQPTPAAKRNVDLVMLTTDVDQVNMRIEKENYLPLDGMLTQSGDVHLKVTNLGAEPLKFTGGRAPSGGNWTEHSPYWVHLRNWKAPVIEVAPRQTSDWVEVGGLMDTLSGGQWSWTGNGKYKAEFGLKNPQGKIEPLAVFTGDGDLKLAADGDTRYSRRLRTTDAVVYDLLAWLKKENPAPHGKAPRLTPIFGYTFPAIEGNAKHQAAVAEFKQMFGLTDTQGGSTRGLGYIDVRSVATPKLAEYCQNLGAEAKQIRVVSLGDEISLPRPKGDAAGEQFHAWLKSRGLKPADILPAAGNAWEKIIYSVDPKLKDSQPGVYYWSMRYLYHYGIQATKERTDILRKHLPQAAIGANYSPHYPQEHMFLGEVYKWVSVFRENGMTLPWSEDYIWQVAVGTPQMNNINLDLFRAANRAHPERDVMYYVMAHAPNNTPRQWRRLFHGAVGHGATMINLFEFRPVQTAYTENHVDEPAMYGEVLKSFRELGTYEDIIQQGQVKAGQAALWFSETGDIWGDSKGSHAAAKRGLYTAIRHQQIPLDFIVEDDALSGVLSQYKVLYLTDAHVSSAASTKIAAWVQAGGQLFATAGAGMFDEQNQPNATLRNLLGVQQQSLEEPADKQIIWLKQDLPFTASMATVDWPVSEDPPEAVAMPVYSVRSRITTTEKPMAMFRDGGPAVVVRQAGKGKATYCAFLPSLSYYAPAIPQLPVDRGASDDAMVHFLPTDFDPQAAALIAAPAEGLHPSVLCSQPLVESTVIESKSGTAVFLVNWTPDRVSDLKVTITLPGTGKKAKLASGAPLKMETGENGAQVVTLDLETADVLIFR